MKSQQGKDDGGTLIRGAEGALYFIPESELQAFRVDEETTKRVHEVLDQEEDVRILTALPEAVAQKRLGLRAGGATVVCVNTNAVRQWSK